MPTRMLALVGPVLASVLVGPLRLGVQDSQRQPVVAFDGLSAEQLRTLSVSDLLVRMPADPWIKTSEVWTLKAVPEELQRRTESGFLSDDDWVRALTAADVIHTRPRWPVGEPLGAWIRMPGWLRRAQITAQAIDPDLGRISASDMNPESCLDNVTTPMEARRLLDFMELPGGTRHVDLEITIDLGPPQGFILRRIEGTEPERQLWRGAFRLSVEAVPSFEEALPAVSDDETDAAVRNSLRANWWRDEKDSARRCLLLTIGGECEQYPNLRKVALSLTVEFRKGGVPVAEVHLLALHGGGNDGFAGWIDQARIQDLPEDLNVESLALEAWDLRVTGTRKDVLTLWEADRWWSGSFVMPLSEALRARESK